MTTAPTPRNSVAGSPRVVIAHDDALVLEILASACTRRKMQVVAIAQTCGDLVLRCHELAPDVAVTGEQLDGEPVEDVLDSLRRTEARVVLLSAMSSPERLGRLLDRDVSGYLSHDAGLDEVVNAITTVARGEMAVNTAVLTAVLHESQRLRSQPVTLGVNHRATLTPREQEVVAAMADGLSAKAVAVRLGMATKTVENHKIRIFEKLGVKSQAHAVTVSMAYGLTRGATASPSGLVS